MRSISSLILLGVASHISAMASSLLLNALYCLVYSWAFSITSLGHFLTLAVTQGTLGVCLPFSQLQQFGHILPVHFLAGVSKLASHSCVSGAFLLLLGQLSHLEVDRMWSHSWQILHACSPVFWLCQNAGRRGLIGRLSSIQVGHCCGGLWSRHVVHSMHSALWHGFPGHLLRIG